MRLLLPIGLCLAAVLLGACFGDAPTSTVNPDSDIPPADTIHRADSGQSHDTLHLDSNWSQAASAAAGATIKAVAQGDSLFVAVGAGGVIVTSADGSTWKPAASGISQDLASVTRGEAGGAEVFVAVGKDGTVLTSADGATWAPLEVAHQSIGTIGGKLIYPSWFGVAWNGSVFVAMGNGSTVSLPDIPEAHNVRLISTDGVHWTYQHVSRGFVPVYVALIWDPALAGGEGRFVATLSSGTLSYSKDGEHWTSSP
jgi:hypothetical protein